MIQEGKNETLGMKEGQILLGKSNSMFFPINSLKYIWLWQQKYKISGGFNVCRCCKWQLQHKKGKAKGT